MDYQCQRELVEYIPHQTGYVYWTLYFKINQALEKIEKRLICLYGDHPSTKNAIHNYVYHMTLQDLLDFRISKNMHKSI